MAILETKRLLLREFEDRDLPVLSVLVANPDVMKFSDGVESAAVAIERLKRFRRSYRERGYGKWAVESKESKCVIGYCGFADETFDGETLPEIGFRFFPHVWGQGLATESATGCAAHAFAQLQFRQFLGFAHPENRASCRVLEKIGMRFLKSSMFHGQPVVVYQQTVIA